MCLLDFVLPLVLAKLVPKLVERSLVLAMFADPAPPVRRLPLNLGSLICLNDLVKCLVLLPFGSPVNKGATLADQHFFRWER